MTDSVWVNTPPSMPARIAKILILLAAVVMLNSGGAWLAHQVNFQLYPRHEPMLHIIILASFGLYVLLMTLPFMPGMEVGLALMLFLGGKGVILVYICTLIALSISYAIGRRIPPDLFARLLGWFYLNRARDLVLAMKDMSHSERVSFLQEKAPTKIAPHLLQHRYLAIAALLNVPCNALIGGGGGIAFIAGMSGIVTYPKYLLLIAVAISPVPITIFINGAI